MDIPEVPQPVVVTPAKPKVSMLNEIASATTKEEVETLLVKCTTPIFKKASPDTVRKWDKAARIRLAAIEKEAGNAQANR